MQRCPFELPIETGASLRYNRAVQAAQLIPHPTMPCASVRRIDVRVTRQQSELAIEYRVEGAIDRLRVPAERPRARADRLWQHTCFELFAAAGGSAYCELNFSPSREWAAYRFSSDRKGMRNLETPTPRIETVCAGTHFELRARIELAPLCESSDATELSLGLSAVIEDDAGISYWALRHPAAKPDFHHAGGFVFKIPMDRQGRAP